MDQQIFKNKVPQDQGIDVEMASHEAVFQLNKDRFKSVTIDSEKNNHESDEDFDRKMEASLAKWRTEGVRGVWVKISLRHSSLVPICAKHKFEFHHAKPGYVMMLQFLPVDQLNTMPEYANQYLGCAGFVVNEMNQVLVVKEKYALKPHWKLPGGHANLGEEIAEAAAREVFEETGVRSEFQAVISFRHQHQYRYGCSDFYFVCLMKPLTYDLKKCDAEIAECQWMDLEEYISSDIVSEGNRYIAQCYKDLIAAGHSSIQVRPLISYDRKKYHKCYSMKPIAEMGKVFKPPAIELQEDKL